MPSHLTVIWNSAASAGRTCCRYDEGMLVDTLAKHRTARRREPFVPWRTIRITADGSLQSQRPAYHATHVT